MRLMIIGHSNALTDAKGEAGGHWPVRLRDGLSDELGQEIELSGIRLLPYGPKAVPYALSSITEARPDYIVISLGLYMCAVGVVSLRVRQRFGERAERAFTRLQQTFSRQTEGHPEPFRRQIDHAGRWLTRRVIGTATFATTEEVLETYRGIITGIASMEHVQLVVMGEHFFSRQQRRENPEMECVVRLVHRDMKALADDHHFLWANVERAFRESGKRDEMSDADGVHNSPAGHQAIAEMLIPLISGAEKSRLASADGG